MEGPGPRFGGPDEALAECLAPAFSARHDVIDERNFQKPAGILKQRQLYDRLWELQHNLSYRKLQMINALMIVQHKHADDWSLKEEVVVVVVVVGSK